MPTAPFLAPERDEAFKQPRGKQSGGTVYVGLPGVVFSAVATNSPVGDRDWYHPFRVTTPLNVDQLLFEITTLEAAKNARVGIYRADTDWQPIFGPLVDSGDISVATTGVKTYTPGTPLYLPRGNYLTVFNSNSTGSVATRNFRGSVSGEGVAVATLGTNPYWADFNVIRTYAAFPSPGTRWSTGTATSTAFLYPVLLRVSAQ